MHIVSPPGVSPYLTVEQVAERLHISRRAVHERTRLCEIPHRRITGTRRCLFLASELDAWVNGAALEVVETADGSRVVRPKIKAAA
jgi:excisionase family DNA binding protein